MAEKREPITIDVTPDKVEIERPRRVVGRVGGRVTGARNLRRSQVAGARNLQRMGEIVQTPNFWLGLIAELWRTRR